MTKRFGEFAALDHVSLKVAARHVPRAARRERRRQEHAGQVHHGLLPGRRGQVHGRRSPARRSKIRARRTRSASAWSTSISRWSGHDRGGESGPGARRVPAVFDWARSARRSKNFLTRMPFRVPLERQGLGDLAPASSRNARSSSSSICSGVPHPRRADLGADAATRPTKCSACCAGWWRQATSPS